MNQSNEHIEPLKVPVRANKNFVYNGESYPIDFCLVKKYSNFFYLNRKKFKSVQDIEIKPENYEIIDEAVPKFVACCQSQSFDINDSNVFSLYQLSIQYDVPILNDLTSQYIKKNPKQLVFDSIFFKMRNENSKDDSDLSIEEEMIASDFFEFIDDKRLLSLPISVLYHIISNKHLDINSMDSTKQNQIIEFLFNCLDKYQREASILFLNIDLENERIDLLPRLLARYSNVFDFNFINPKFLAKNTSFLMGQLKSLKLEYTNKLAEMQSENTKQKECFTASQNSFNESKSSLEKRLLDLENKMNQLEEKVNEQAKKLERYTSIKVSKIEIICDPKVLGLGSTITLSTLIKPKYAFNDGVEWQILQEEKGVVNVESKNEKILVLKGLIPSKKVTVVATALDGSGITSRKELIVGYLKGAIELKVQQDQLIKGTIKITEEGGVTMDKSKSKYILNTNNSFHLRKEDYESGFTLDSLVKDVSIKVPVGIHYLHVLIVDTFGNSQELISKKMIAIDNSLRQEISQIKENMLKEIADYINLPKVMVFGSTGSGKTSLANALADSDIKIIKGPGNRACLDGNGIMHGNLYSRTFLPSFLIDSQKRFIFCDFLSFYDFSDLKKEIIISYIADYLFHENTSVILLVESEEEIYRNMGKSLSKSIENVLEMLGDASQLKKKFAIIITKGDQEMTGENYLEMLGDNMRIREKKFMKYFGSINAFSMPKPKKSDIGKKYDFEDKNKIIDFILSNINK
ncbi:hypothetical protein M9Y10_015495 [Tritrichomonas musculus]|uniref:AAA+ ATPase domain-containing protein n=1 Tax=Tritrichomonas musculus TaxID=1915356 RepID=A0ABR2L2F1_9EUKA